MILCPSYQTNLLEGSKLGGMFLGESGGKSVKCCFIDDESRPLHSSLIIINPMFDCPS